MGVDLVWQSLFLDFFLEGLADEFLDFTEGVVVGFFFGLHGVYFGLWILAAGSGTT